MRALSAHFCVALLISLLATDAVAMAEDRPATPPPGEPTGLNGLLSVGVAAMPDYEGSKDYTAAAGGGGKIGYNEYYVEIQGLSLRANVMPAVLPFGFEFGPALAYRLGRSDVENDRVDALRNIDGTVALGGFARVFVGGLLTPDDELGFEAQSLTGIGEHRDGTTISFGPGYGFSPWERVHLGVKISATYASDRYNQTYFGIDADNAARSGFSTFDAQGGIENIGLSVNAAYELTERWGVTGMIGISRLVGDAADSPIVKDAGNPTQGMAMAGIAYRF